MAQALLHPPTPDLAMRYPVPRWTAAWAVPEVPVPESDTHDAAVEWLRALHSAWVARAGRDIKVLALGSLGAFMGYRGRARSWLFLSSLLSRRACSAGGRQLCQAGEKPRNAD